MSFPHNVFNSNEVLSFLTNELFHHNVQANHETEKMLFWLRSAPRFSTLRVNTLTTTVEDVIGLLKKAFQQQCAEYNITELPVIYVHPELLDTIVVGPWNVSNLDLEIKQLEVIVDVACGAAVLRGADVFAPGVMGIPSGAHIGDTVSVFADVSKKCRKGLQSVYSDDQKYFVGNGTVKMPRKLLYGKEAQSNGVAVQMISRPSGCPSLPSLLGFAVLQNLPSILTCHVLNPTPGECVLDCCAAPGNKTLHIASLMDNKGKIVALDKTEGKVNVIRRKCEEFSVRCVEAFAWDTTKSVKISMNSDDRCTSTIGENTNSMCPPFAPGSFDRVLLDAPCSALGQRPQLCNNISLQQLKSYPSLQRKLFKAAQALLKPGGCLVYSTCTITVAENEGIISWALNTYPQLSLETVLPRIGGVGISSTGNLTEEQAKKVQRFGPPDQDSIQNSNTDTLGFFIACFRKETFPCVC